MGPADIRDRIHFIIAKNQIPEDLKSYFCALKVIDKHLYMKPKIAAQSGTFESSDVIFLIEPLSENSGRKLEISSTVMQQFGANFNRIVIEMLDQYEMTDIHLIAKDKGALEPTIKARLETAIKRSLDEQEGTLK
jgi:citrate lyase subunit gamma (acyl carrier protein)